MRALTLALLALVPPASADVLIVDPSGSQGFSQIQAAIDAAQDGDLILVRAGTYAGFTIQQRSLTVRADVNAEVQVGGGVVVRDTPADGVVLLGELDIEGASAPFGLPAQPGEDGLSILDNDGIVRVEGCKLAGGWGAPFVSQQGSPGGAGCNVEDSLRTALVGCELDGGIGGGDPFTTSLGGVGGTGLRTTGSGVALYDCDLTGGTGGVADLFVNQTGGPGGVGCEVLDFGLFASNTTIRGGGGGYGWAGGDGGDGLVVHPGGQGQLLESLLVQGFGGFGESGSDGLEGEAQSGGGPITVLPGSARSLTTSGLARDGATLEVTVIGEPGDEVWIVPGKAAAHLPALALGGVWLVQRPVFLTKAPAVVLGPSGTAVVSVPTGAVGASEASRELYLQVFVRPLGGALRIGGPAHVSVVDCASVAPDCNGTGAWDGCDLLAGTSNDCDANSVPDECELDCNGNGVTDACDIEIGTSADQNGNGVPDECEPQGITLHVDASAPAGGDGSPGAPFRTIGEGIAASIDGYRVLVADGVYSGPGNHSLGFGGRELVVESANGSAACTIDCDDQGNAFFIQHGESAATRIQGFTIVDGSTGSWGGGIRLYQSDTEIRDVVFVSCNANEGGGLDLTASSAIVRDCRFEGCSAGDGGGLSVRSNGAPSISRCVFLGNSAIFFAGKGGGILVENVPQLLMSNLTLIGNQCATGSGGGVYAANGSLALANASFAGNTAVEGAAVRVSNCDLYLSGATLAGNVASGADAIRSGTGGTSRDLVLRNCVLWDDPVANNAVVGTTSGGIAIEVERSDLRGGQASVFVAAGSSLLWGPGNLDLDPLFVDADGPDNDPLTFGDNDYRLGAGSPCIDAGDNALVVADVLDLDGDLDTLEPTPIDLDGNPRFVDDPAVADTGAGTPPIVDLGAYERP